MHTALYLLAMFAIARAIKEINTRSSKSDLQRARAEDVAKAVVPLVAGVFEDRLTVLRQFSFARRRADDRISD
jgi:hypothetical protein